MSNIKPIKPSHTFGYWRPWKEDSNFFDSYLDYVRDTSLVKYGADTVGSYINQASKEQVQAISELGKSIGMGLNVLSSQMSDINDSLFFLNRNIDLQIEQQKMSNLLLQNITELLRVPDSEKERQHCIELGIKFFVNGQKDQDLYTDALEELLKAEELMKQDYFVLHRIGCIYLYIEKYINPEKALEYFSRAAKYASVESDVSAVRLANILNKRFETVNSHINNSEKQIGFLAADSYEKASFAAYILGRFDEAVNFQIKALRFNPSDENKFLLAKYQVRNNNIKEAIDNLSQSIDENANMFSATFKEIDLINEIEVVKLLTQKNDIINNKIIQLAEKWKIVESTRANKVLIDLSELLNNSYELKIKSYLKFELDIKTIDSRINE
jgi:tetratricopeptide (TPR) repeat protein